MSRLQFEDKVVVVTGAGGGLGRAHALEFARRGAKVVVNDLGGGTDGTGASNSAADTVVKEIKDAGGEAVANYDSVEFGEKIIQTAMDTYSRIDVVINNAGILRDSSFSKMTDDDWDLIYKVHVHGAYKVTKAAWPFMIDQQYGRIIFTTSSAGLYGNFGQTNYSSAKCALVGLGQSLAIEGDRKNVLSNIIAPLAGSRLTEQIWPKTLTKAFSPELVTPLIIRLCANENKENGGIFEVGAGWFAKVRFERTKGLALGIDTPISAEQVDDRWEELCDFSGAVPSDGVPGTVMAASRASSVDIAKILGGQ